MARDGTGRTQQRGFLSRDLIVREALALLREDGAGALSMRRLANRLGVAPNALYTHVRGKADLVDGLIDQVYAGLELDPDPAGDRPEQLAAISRDVRAQLLAHPAVVPRLHGFFAALPGGEFPHTVELAPLLARISTEDQFEFGIRIFLAGLETQRPGQAPG
jgi:AcrR family transcriptional regulator